MNTANKRKSKYRFNIVDILLLLIIVLSVCAILLLIFYDGSGDDTYEGVKTVELIYTVEQSELPDILRGKINIGDSVIDSSTLKELGQVIDVEYIDSIYTGFDPESNSSFQAIYPGKIDMRVRIGVEAVVDENGIYSVNGCILNVGEKIDMRFPYYTGEAVCISVSEVSK